LGRDALETAREYNLNVGVGGDNRKKVNSEWFKRNEYIVATSIDAPQHVRVDTRGSQTEGIKDVASLRLALSPINFNHGTTNHAVHHFVIHLLLVCYSSLLPLLLH
jgi:hypothetical protein